MKHFVIEMENGATMSGELYEDIAPKSVEISQNFVKRGSMMALFSTELFQAS